MQSTKMRELRIFLQNTIPLQAEYMARHLQEILPKLLAYTPGAERELIYKNFYALARIPAGIYALVDYLNFKGPGLYTASCNMEYGSGLLQVLRGMKYAPPSLSPLRAYVWSAKRALVRRVSRNNATVYDDKWLAGWFKRLDTYLEAVQAL